MRKEFKIIVLLFALSFSGIQLNAQTDFTFNIVNNNHAVVEFISLGIAEGEFIVNPKQFNYTSIKLELDHSPELPVSITYFDPKDQKISSLLNFNTDQASPDSNGLSSAFYIFISPQNRTHFNFGSYRGVVRIHLMYAPVLPPSVNLKQYKRFSGCDKPSMISYEVWRQGLPDPKPPRETTSTEHLVVHHSAGNNGDTNYLNVIRNIYLLHTQSNGWDDIGYNYLIAADGTVFMGRDPQGAGEEDNILGAHFCGKNTNTMGVCLMGNFMDVKPDPRAIFSLKYLLAWKLKKEKMDAFGQTMHPKPTGNLLNAVCGHRDGCNTSCPGDSLYALLTDVKKEAARIADSCGLVLSYSKSEKTLASNLFPNPNTGNFTITTNAKAHESEVFIYTTSGALIFNTKFISGQYFELFLPQGFYYYLIKQKDQKTTPGKLLIKNK